MLKLEMRKYISLSLIQITPTIVAKIPGNSTDKDKAIGIDQEPILYSIIKSD